MTTNKRTYTVLTRNDAARFGLKNDGAYNEHVLVAMRGESVIDNVVCWGFKKDNLQAIADKRNADFSKMQEKFSTAMLNEEIE